MEDNAAGSSFGTRFAFPKMLGTLEFVLDDPFDDRSRDEQLDAKHVIMAVPRMTPPITNPLLLPAICMCTTKFWSVETVL